MAAADSEDSEGEELGLIRPKFLGELRNVLHEYPDDGQILKEMIQNAEDAGAKTIKIIADRRHFSENVDKALLKKHPHLMFFKGPALCVYNDAYFTEDDWKGIRMLHTSIKETDPLKVGRFGLGFKSVFHLTDRLVIMSGDRIMYMDPFKGEDRYCNSKRLAERKGVELHSILNALGGTFGISQQTFDSGTLQGTLFWFPLRNAPSELSQTVYSEKNVEDLMNAFRAEARTMILFLKNIESICLSSRHQDHSLKDEFKVTVHSSCLQNVRAQRRSFIAMLQQAKGSLLRKSIHSQNELAIETVDYRKSTRTNIERWLVVNYHPGARDISAELSALCADPHLAYQPLVGVAVPLTSHHGFQSHIFCFLPLPLDTVSPTGLPVHVNGFFALSQNRRHIKWPSADQQNLKTHTEPALRWNCLLVEEVLPRAYGVLLHRLKELCITDPTLFYKAWPDSTKVVDKWRPLLGTLYKEIASKDFFYTDANKGSWISLGEAVHGSFPGHLDPDVVRAVTKVYNVCNENLVTLPRHVEVSLEEYGFKPARTVSPEHASALVHNCFEQLDASEKLLILQYLLSHHRPSDILTNLQLLPLENGSFGKFDRRLQSSSDQIYWCDERLMQLLPGLGDRFCDARENREVREKLRTIAKSDVFNFQQLQESSIILPRLFERSLQIKLGNGPAVLCPRESETWIERIWNFLSTSHPWSSDLTSFLQINLLPDIYGNRFSLVPLNRVYVCGTIPGMNALSKDLISCLSKLQVKVLTSLPVYVTKHSQVLGKLVQYPSNQGVTAALIKVNVNNSLRLQAIQTFNASGTKEERIALTTFLNESDVSVHDMKSLLQALKLFTEAKTNTTVSFNEINVIGPQDLPPVRLPGRYLTCTQVTRRVALSLGASEETLVKLVQTLIQTATEKLTPAETTTLMKYFLDNKSLMSNQALLSLAKEIQFVPTKSGQLLKARELYDPDCQLLVALFTYEERFPIKEFSEPKMLMGLRKLGLRNESSLSEDDLIATAKIIDTFTTHINSTAALSIPTPLINKANALWKLLSTHGHNIQMKTLDILSNLQCLPCLQKEQNSTEYPPDLPLRTESVLVKPMEMCLNSSMRLFGSVLPVMMPGMPNSICKHLGVGSQENIDNAFQHLKNVINHFSISYSSQYQLILCAVFHFLSEHRSNSKIVKALQANPCVMIESEGRFAPPNRFWVQKARDDIDLRPYRFILPMEMSKFSDLFLTCGSSLHQDSTLLQSVLTEIQQKHSHQQTTDQDFRIDMRLVKQILDILKTCKSVKKGTIIIPVYHDQDNSLHFRQAKDCTIGQGTWQMSYSLSSGEEEVWFVHPDIPQSTALALGALSMKERALTGAEELDFGYGQHEELTNRLHNLLKDSYTDGFSVPKELIQNADDAGATEIKFLLDERENRDCRTNLITERMASLQGPALWAFNNSVFSDKDFENIVKLGGGTKREDAAKVGKFGLGFNSVYNLTDAPSFISRHIMAVFDPQVKYLEGAGLKLDFKKPVNHALLRKMPETFKPFQGIFGCRLQKEKEVCYNGTLFRFPLRTPDQAENSKLKAESYSPEKRKEFLKMLLNRGGSLLMFTQRIQRLEVYYIHENCDDPTSASCLLTVTKHSSQELITPAANHINEQSILQFCTAQWSMNPDIKIREFVDIHVRMMDSATAICNVRAGLSTTKWCIAWATGTGQSAEIARKHKEEGLIPLAAAGVPMKDGCIETIANSPDGFYRTGHLFCFLPLPEEMVRFPLFVHLNGTFALSSNRRGLHIQTEDDLQSAEGTWNLALFADAICRAYLLLLESLQSTTSGRWLLNYFEFWPKGEDEMNLTAHFFKHLESDGNKVLPTTEGKEWTSFQNALFLDPDFMESTCGEIAWKTLQKFRFAGNKKLVNVPVDISRCMKASCIKHSFEGKVLGELYFYKTIFFPRIDSNFWEEEERDKLVFQAVMHKDPAIQDLVRDSECIPCSNSDILRKPSDLVHPEKLAAKLFLESDSFFPKNGNKIKSRGQSGVNFCSAESLEHLVQLGMMTDSLPEEMLLDRAKSVASLSVINYEEAKTRAHNIIEYLSSICEKGFRFNLYSLTLKESLSKTEFLPILPKPGNWPFPWAGSDRNIKLAAPSDIFSDNLKDLVACSAKILDLNTGTSYRWALRSNKNVYNWLGLTTEENHQDTDLIILVISQLQAISGFYPQCKQRDKELVEIICNKIYAFLNRCCMAPSHPDTVAILSEENSVWTGNQFVPPLKVAFDCKYNCRPYLYQLENPLKQYLSLCEALGVKKTFSKDDAISAINAIHEEYHQLKLSEEKIQLMSRLAQLLCDAVKQDQSKEDIGEMKIFLPDRHGYLQPVGNLCLDDCPWLSESESMKFVHESISPGTAKVLGVQTKREMDYNILVDMIPFGQSEKLTNRIKRLLQGYTCDSSLFKELLQNADDAGATEIKFIKDFRSLKTERVPSGWENIQGPSLCIYNNSSFTSKDMQGIQCLGEGSKGQDLLKTGKYGVGFNAVYHLTDVPSFWTRLDEKEPIICVFDPNCKYVKNATLQNPGAMFKNIDRVKQEYPDMFSGYLENIVVMSEPGTLFRLPLRTEEMARKSDIKSVAVTPKYVGQLLDEFKSEMKICLLFLNNLRKISICSLDENCDLSLEYEVNMNLSKHDSHQLNIYKGYVQQMLRNIQDGNLSLGNAEYFEIILNAILRDTKGSEEEWIIVNSAGFKTPNLLSSSLLEEWKKEHFQLLPRGGVALKLSSKKFHKEKHPPFSTQEMHAFCILPLPIKTKLPVHVNGHFALDHETRRGLWNHEDDAQTEWNENIAAELIVPAYIAAIKQARCRWFSMTKPVPSSLDLDARLEWYHHLFPDFEDSPSDFWRNMIKKLYIRIAQHEINLFPVRLHNLEWSPVVKRGGFPGYFNNLVDFYKQQSKHSTTNSHLVLSNYSCSQASFHASDDERFRKKAEKMKALLKKLNMKVLEMPYRIFKNFLNCGIDGVREISPMSVIQFLKSSCRSSTDGCNLHGLPLQLKDTPIQTAENVKLLVTFVKKEPSFLENLEGLPLCLRQSGTLTVFHDAEESDKPVVSDFYTLLPGSASAFVHKEIYSYFNINSETAKRFVRKLSIPIAANLLPQTLAVANFKTEHAIIHDPKTFPSTEWLKEFWKFIESQVMLYTGNCETDILTLENEISLLAAWSLIPVKQKFGGNDFDVLYPVKYMNIVVYLTKDDDPSNSRLWNILQTLPLPFLDNSHLPHITVLTRLVASISNPMALLQSLIQESIECPQEHAYIILSYFDNTLRVLQKTFTSKKLLIDTIKKLPFFTSIDGSLMSCKAASRILCLPDCIPKDGLTSWSKAQSLTLLQKEFVPPNLSTYLGFIVPNITEFYCNDLLTTLVYLPRNAIISHMTFLKSYSCPEDEKKKLECHLQTTAFIEMNNQLHMASEYYLPSEPVFKAMLPPTSFPPAPFSNPDWNHFMKLAGINHCVTSEMFIHFAEEVQEEGTLLCSEKTQEKSYILVQHLFGRNDLTSSHLLSEVSEIRFVCQSKWWLESEGQLLRLIVRPYSNDRLISFSESCPTQHLHLVWSSSCLIDERASPLRQEFASLAKRQQVLDQLKFKELVPMEKVLCHVRNVCLSLAGDLCQVMCSLHTDLMTMVMSDIYGFLDKLTLSAAVIKELQNLPIICHIDRKRMFKPENVVLYLGEEQAIEDHIEQYPTVFGAYFKFFEKLGSVQKVTANHYAKVLLFLKKQVKDNTLHVKEIIIAKKAVEGLFRCLKSPSKEEKQISVKSLYLPTEDYYLHKSNELIFKDDAYLTKMLPQEQRDMNTFFFIGFEKLKIKTPQPLDEVLLLPDNHRMVWLSTIVKQVVPNHIKSAATVTENSQRLARTLADPKRINGLIRLVYHQCKKDEKEFNQNTADQIVKSLSHINIVEVADLRVCLEYKNEIVKDSSRQVYSFTEKNTCDVRKCTVYLAKCACLAWEESQDRFEHELANAIEFVLNTSLSNYHLHDILKNPTKATATMDEDGIETCNFTDNIEHSAFPLLGTFVPVDQHCYLDNGFSDFSVGEYVGYELYDPQLDTGDEDETDAVFIYARVLRLEAEEWANEQLLNTKYCICLSPDGREAVVSATKLYKFIRKLSEDEDSDDDVPHPHDISVVLREIRRTLTEAWDGLDETDRKRVVKRLYLKWFPDGDVNKDFCDRVLQKIQHYVNLLENGGTFNVESGEETDLVSIRGRRRTIMTTTFFHRMYRRGKRRSEFYSQSARGASAGDFIQRTYNACLQIYDHSSKPNPQPGEGRRWLRQAKADLSAALSSMNCVQEYNWICFQCHQAVEKALKAILYYRDSSGESELRSHEIVWLANSARDNDLLQLVRDLERCVGSNMRMRYPDMLDYPKIPHDVYTSDQATRACALADQIVKRIQHLLQE